MFFNVNWNDSLLELLAADFLGHSTRAVPVTLLVFEAKGELTRSKNEALVERVVGESV